MMVMVVIQMMLLLMLMMMINDERTMGKPGGWVERGRRLIDFRLSSSSSTALPCFTMSSHTMHTMSSWQNIVISSFYIVVLRFFGLPSVLKHCFTMASVFFYNVLYMTWAADCAHFNAVLKHCFTNSIKLDCPQASSGKLLKFNVLVAIQIGPAPPLIHCFAAPHSKPQCWTRS